MHTKGSWSKQTFRRLAAAAVLAVVATFCWPVTAAQATIQPGIHYCEDFTGSGEREYRGGQCYDLDKFVNSEGDGAFRTRGQSFCQYQAAPNAVVPCAGVSQTVTIRDDVTGVSVGQNFTCGRYHPDFTPCPGGRFEHYSPGVYCVSGHSYTINVSTTVILPERARVARGGSIQRNVAWAGSC
ncbi:hypothetical protein [Actinoplanes sp. NPDC049802]|uniref:hypothetical protein n=1 Tax=Actinoplanes sp. NPDC049802 TaxID=3154742 RepID=UPI0033EC1F64